MSPHSARREAGVASDEPRGGAATLSEPVRDCSGRRRPRVLFLDPLGHLLGSHDHAICQGLVTHGCDVILGSNEYDPSAGDDLPYERFTPYRGVVGDGNRAGKVINYLRSMRRILSRARTERLDAAVLYFVLQPHLDGLLIRSLKRIGVRTVVCAHDVLPLESDRDVLGGYRRLYNAASRVLVFGEYARDRLVERLAYPRPRVSVAYLGVDHVVGDDLLDTHRAREQLGVPLDGQMVLCIGTIRPSKGVDDLLRAFAQTREAHPRARLWVLGRPLRVDLAPYYQLAKRLDLGDRLVIRPVHVRQDLVPVWLQAADVVVHPDTRLYESGIVTQACAYGRPIIVTNVGNIAELLHDGESAWIVPAGDPGTMAGAITAALADPGEAGRRGQAAREMTQRRCSWLSVAERLAEMIGPPA